MIPSACWHNLAGIGEDEDGSLRLSRVPLSLFPHLNPKAIVRAECPAGAEIRFRPKSPETHLILRRMPDKNPAFQPPGAALVGVFHGDFQNGWHALEGKGDTVISIRQPAAFERLIGKRERFHPEMVRVVLPPFPSVRLVSLEGEIEAPDPADSPDLLYLAYGSSITHGAYTPLGTGTYPAVIGRELGVDAANLGFGGGAHLEPELADWLVSRTDWRFISLEMGINVLGLFEIHEFRDRVRRFLLPFRNDPLSRPVVCLDILRRAADFFGMDQKANAFRRIVAEETAALNLPRIRHVDFANAIDCPADLSDDLLHPSAAAFEKIGQYLAAKFRQLPDIARLLEGIPKH